MEFRFERSLFLRKVRPETQNGFLVNKDWYNPVSIPLNQLPSEIADFKYRINPFDDPFKRKKNDSELKLEPSEICLFVE